MGFMIQSVNHITLSVRDIERSFHFYTAVLGMQPLAKWPQGAYLLAGDMWLALVVDKDVRKRPLPEYTHVAFTVSPDDFSQMCRQILQADTRLWQENKTEGDSLYFLDPDGHKLEIHASDLATRLKTAKERPWAGLEFLD
jgi:catechol 2,3-dioxygenase-like lactoylglutathione lyase family enzyme